MKTKLRFDWDHPIHLLSLFTIAFLLLAIPLTVALTLQSEQSVKKPHAATTVPNPLSELINTRGDHLALHQITLPVPTSFSWYAHSEEDTKSATGPLSLNEWLVVERDVSQLATTFSAQVDIKNMRMYVHIPGTGWVQAMNGMPSWTVTSNTETNGSYVDIGHNVESDGSWSFAFPPNLALHMSQTSPGYVVNSSYDGVASVVEARVIGPDAALTKWGLNAGADIKPADGSCTGICNPVGIGRFGLLTTNYESYVMLSSTMTDAQVQADPPPTFTTTITPKVGDVNGDGSVNGLDLSVLISNWNSTSNLQADLNGDGKVNALDLSALLSHWGT